MANILFCSVKVRVSVPKRLKTASSDLRYTNWYQLWPWYGKEKTESSLPYSCIMRKQLGRPTAQ